VPFAPASRTLTASVLAVNPRLSNFSVSPTVVDWGGEVLHSVFATWDTVAPITGATVIFQWNIGGAWRDVCSATTDANGRAVCRWRVPFAHAGTELPCRSYDVRAWLADYNIYTTTTRVSVRYPTRLDASLDKTQYYPGDTATIRGSLVTIVETSPGVTGTRPMSGRTITITFWDGRTATVTTGTDGSFTYQFKVPTTGGNYNITVSYAGEGLVLGLGVQPTRALSRGLVGLLQEAPPLLTIAGLAISTAGLAVSLAHLKHRGRY
jgi:hypothetical protein